MQLKYKGDKDRIEKGEEKMNKSKEYETKEIK